MCLANIDVAILCGGHGTRIASVLGDTPKILAPLGKSNHLAHTIDWLRKYDARHIYLLARERYQQIGDWLLENHTYPPHISVVNEAYDRGTAGAVLQALPFLNTDPVLVMNGDTILDYDVCQFVDHHIRGRQQEKIIASVLANDTVSCGFYLLSRAVLERMCRPYESTEPNLDAAVLRACTSKKKLQVVNGNFDFIDIGTPEGYERAKALYQ